MTATTTLQKALAAQVALPLAQLPETAGHCPAWIDSKGAECKRPATDGLLCRRHHHVAERRLAAAIEKRQAEAVKAAEKAPAPSRRETARADPPVTVRMSRAGAGRCSRSCAPRLSAVSGIGECCSGTGSAATGWAAACGARVWPSKAGF